MNKLREIRKEKNLSGTEIAEAIHINEQYYYALERGARRLNEDIIKELVKVLKVSSDEILGISQDHKPNNDKLFELIKELPNNEKDKIYNMIKLMYDKH